MKRLIKTDMKLSDIVSRVIYIEFCSDVTRKPCVITASTDPDNDSEDIDFASMINMDQIRYEMSDEQLMKMSDEHIATVIDPLLLIRLIHLCKDRLNESQIQIVTDYCSTHKIFVDKGEVQKFLSLLKSCNNVGYDRRHPRTNEFVLDANGNFRENDCLRVIKSLTINDYRDESMYGANLQYLGDILLVFRPTVPWITSDGVEHTEYTIYVKLDVNLTNGDCVTMVTMHDPKYEDWNGLA